jgi:hypothetical protein
MKMLFWVENIIAKRRTLGETMSSMWVATNRAIGLAHDLLDSLRNGDLSPKLFKAAQNRIDGLLQATPGAGLTPATQTCRLVIPTWG